MNRVLRNTGFYLLIFLVVIGIVKFISSQNEAETVLPYSEFRTQLANSATATSLDQKIKKVVVKFEGYTYLVKGEYASGKVFKSRLPFTDKVFDILDASKVKVVDVEKMAGDSIW